MALTRARKPPDKEDTSGIALFMVIAAISVLSILVTEFSYIAQVNQKIAYDSLDLVKAHYLAKSGLKLSLLRLKAYYQVSAFLNGQKGGAGIPGLPKGVLEKIWSYPFIFPIPTSIPGMTVTQKDSIDSFTKATSLEGKFTALIESESSKYNLNMILAPFVPVASPSPGAPAPPPVPGQPPPVPAPSPTATAFDPKAARQSLFDYLQAIITGKSESDDEFASEYRDYRLEDLVESMVEWADRTVDLTNRSDKDTMKIKRAPYYTVTELHMVPLMDDRLYELFAPTLTATTTPGINVNAMGDATLHALVPAMTVDERKELFKYRDSEEDDNFFKTADDFFSYIQKSVASFRNDKATVDQLRADLAKRNIRIVTSETDFKITIQAEVGQATRLIEAWATLGPNTKATPPGAPPTPPPPGTPPGQTAPPGAATTRPDPGLKITFMRIL